MIEVQIIIPLSGNDGIPFTQAHHNTFEDFVLERFEGFSVLPGTVAGAWKKSGRTFRDTSRIYLVAMESLLDGEKLREVVKKARTHYRQEGIYFRYLTLAETFTE